MWASVNGYGVVSGACGVGRREYSMNTEHAKIEAEVRSA
jgi:hypothetical protein